MKNVFKYLMLLGVAALCAVSCKIAPMDNSHVDVADDVAGAPIPGLTIEVSVTADDAATVTVTPDGAAAYISILVDDNDEDQSALINPDKLYAGSYESVASKLVKADGNPVVLELEDLDANTVYQVYAITASIHGVVGEITNAHFLTTDTAIPEPEKATAKGNAVTVEFSEAISIDDTKAPTAQYFAYNLLAFNAAGELTDGLVGDANVTLAYAKDKNGKDIKDEVVFTVTLDGENPLPDGACFTISYPEGIFVDAVGNLCEAIESAADLDDDDAWDPVGIGGRIATKPFALVDPDEDSETTSVGVASYSFGAPDGVTFSGATKAAAASFTLVHKEGSATSKVDYDLEKGVEWGLSSATAGILVNPFAAAAVPGDQLSFAVAAGSIEDIYGNANAAFGHAYSVSYGYTLADITGTYTFEGTAQYAGAQAEAAVVIAPSDDEDYDLMVYDLFKSTTCFDDLAAYGFPYVSDPFTKFYADFDPDFGILTVYGDWIGAAVGSASLPCGAFGGGDDDEFHFDVPAAGYAVLADPPIYMYVDGGVGTWDRIRSGELVRTSTDYTYVEPADPDPDPAPAPSLKSLKKDASKTVFSL